MPFHIVRLGYKYAISKNLQKPENSLFGWFVTRQLVKRNGVLEQNAAKLSDIQPDHIVLEVGFGPGLGLKSAFDYVKDGPGQVYGTDFSPKMVKLASKMLQDEIAAGKVHLNLGSVERMPYEDAKFDRIFHTNCYYFWPNMNAAVKELRRVMKNDARMICVLNWERIKELKRNNLMQCGDIDIDRYMNSLQANGFQDVHLEDVKHPKVPLQAIYATATNTS